MVKGCLWVQSQTWHDIYKLEDVNLKVEMFERILMEKVNFYLPEKTIKVSENDKTWVDSELLKLYRQCKREYNKRKKITEME